MQSVRFDRPCVRGQLGSGKFNAPIPRSVALAALTAAWLVTAAVQPARSAPPEKELSPSELFTRTWKYDDDASPAGDGLGPMFNGRSCVECHNQGGIGGAGAAKHDVEMLVLIAPEKPSLSVRAKFAEQAAKIHPALILSGRARPSITLHKFGRNEAYDKWRHVLSMLVDYLPAEEVPGRVAMQVVKRNTPSLLGAGQIDAIHPGVLSDIAAQQAKRKNGVHGRLAQASGGGIGKFGWRGQTATLQQFVMGACANELGLNVPGNAQPIDPLDPTRTPPGLDLEQAECDRLVAYVASLRAPVERLAKNQQEEHVWTAGRRVFESVGCADCHMRQVGEVRGIYSDLLLHDMGEKLADRATANFGPTLQRSSEGAPPYYGGGSDVFVMAPPESLRVWRTPPLWGVANTAPYLHDGRAATLEEAIRQHDGEAFRSRRKFEELPVAGREKLLAFLGSLGTEPVEPAVEVAFPDAAAKP